MTPSVFDTDLQWYCPHIMADPYAGHDVVSVLGDQVGEEARLGAGVVVGVQ